MAKLRTFLALEISPDVRSRAVALAGRLGVAGGGVKWVEPENLHLTLQFLGDVPSEEIPEVCRRAGEAASRIGPFRAVFRGAGAFPRPARPRALWLGIGEGSDEMIALQGAIEGSLDSLGFRGERRPFVPHLTIGRVRSPGSAPGELVRLIEKNAGYEAGELLVEEVVVFSSQLDRSGPTYTALAHLPLGGSTG